MKTKDELRTRAIAIAESLLYSDDECEVIWEPLEHVDENVIQDLMLDIAESIYNAMLWAKEKE
jgi:hypothetical protein